MIKEAKALLESVVTSRVKDVTVVKSVKDESHAVMGRKWPLVALVTNPGDFDEGAARTYRYQDKSAGGWKERYARGDRVLPILVRCWAAGEDTADELLGRIIPAIPSTWEYDGFRGRLEITMEEHSDHTGNTSELYLSIIGVSFRAPAALEAGVVPTIVKMDIATAEIAGQRS